MGMCAELVVTVADAPSPAGDVELLDNHKGMGSVQRLFKRQNRPGGAVLVWVGLDLNQRSLRNGFTDRPL